MKGKEISNKDSWKVTEFAVDFVNNINKKKKYQYLIDLDTL